MGRTFALWSTVQCVKARTWKVVWVPLSGLRPLLNLRRVNCRNGARTWFKGDLVLSVEVCGSRILLPRQTWLCKYIGTATKPIKPSFTLATSLAITWRVHFMRFSARLTLPEVNFRLLIQFLGMFECDKKTCVSPIVVCNGHDDCGNGADETLCAVRQCAPFQFRFVSMTPTILTFYKELMESFEPCAWLDESCGFHSLTSPAAPLF